MPEEKLFFTPYSVDNDFFQQEADRLKPCRGELRRKFGVPDDRPLILFCGKLIPKKQPLLLLEAYARVRREHPCALLFAGDGPLRGEVEAAAARQGIADVHITGFLNQREVSQAYVAADLLVLPSAWGETWGLVLNEAMNFGLPVVATDRVGGAVDLVREGENGVVVPHNNSEALAGALDQMVKDPFLRIRLGQRSRKIIQGWGLREVVQGIAQASSKLGIRN
jgi:glycosyltransferase involved in cell wall biosynthesis